MGILERVLGQAEEKLEWKFKLRAKGFDLNGVVARVAEVLGLKNPTFWPWENIRRLLPPVVWFVFGRCGNLASARCAWH